MRRLSAIAILVTLAALTACTTAALNKERKPVAPVPDRAAASATLLSEYLELLQKLVQSPPAEQAEMLATTQRDYELAPTPSHQLRFSLVLAAPGHAGTDLARAQRLLRELMATPETLLPVERALAFLELQKVDSQLMLDGGEPAPAEQCRARRPRQARRHQQTSAIGDRRECATAQRTRRSARKAGCDC